MQIELTNATRKLCVIGGPGAPPKSPLIQKYHARALGLDYIYLCQSVPAARPPIGWSAPAFPAMRASTPPCPIRRILLP